jgi:hypothetical protein
VLAEDPRLERAEHAALKQALARRTARADEPVFGSEGG